jgi:hypothetical protein
MITVLMRARKLTMFAVLSVLFTSHSGAQQVNPSAPNAALTVARIRDSVRTVLDRAHSLARSQL